MINIGLYNTLPIVRKTPQGLYLGNPDEEEVLLPWKYAPKSAVEGESLTVFVYLDSEDRMIATTLQPKVLLHEFACLEVKATTPHGAFLDWGLEKDLFVPFREQAQRMLVGQSYLVYVYLDKESDRLVASSKLGKFLKNTAIDLQEGEEVEIIIWEPTALGMNVIVNQKYKGLIYHNEIFARIQPGDVRKAYISKIREEQKIDVVLQKPGYERIEPTAAAILSRLKSAGGFLPLTDKSEPHEVASLLEISKKTFKKAVGTLYKQRLIRLEADGIYLMDKAVE